MTKIEEIEEQLTYRGHVWALGQMKLGLTVRVCSSTDVDGTVSDIWRIRNGVMQTSSTNNELFHINGPDLNCWEVLAEAWDVSSSILFEVYEEND